ncbi:MAG: translocation/assembly module TamB domain-containing protein [Acidobacteriia bacterium]|nr:translocation/assembly module TamB domain-containing protein [Terriglobia bacterium]
MTEPKPKPNPRRLWKYLLGTGVAGVLLLAGAGWYTTTDSFQAMVRRRLVSELERVTGGRVELGGFHTLPFRLRVDVRDLTIHGLEKPGDVPYAHVDRLVADVKVISALGAEFGFSSVVLDRPVVDIIFYPDGTTNQPQPKLKSASPQDPMQRMFALSIRKLEVRHGELIWDNQIVPLDFKANDISADMNYSLLHQRYESNLLLGKVDTKLQDCRPFAWTAEAHFSLGQNGVEVKSLKATSGRLRLEASGRIDDFRKPKVDATYDVTLDLAEVAAILRRPEARGGTLQASGHGSWSVSDFFSTGKLQLKDVDWRDESVNLRKASLNAQYSATPQRLTLSQIQARVFGGSAEGDADIANWLALPTAKKPADEQKGVVRLRLKDISASELTAGLATPSHPLNRLNVGGTVKGTIEARWVRTARNLETEIALDLVPPSQPSPGQLPLNLHARAKYRAAAGELEVAEFNASTRASQLRASGTLSSMAALKLSVATTDLAELRSVLEALGSSQRIPLALHGHASFNGIASGRLPDVTLAGNLQVQDFDVLLPATSRRPGRQVHWDSLVADVQTSQHVFAVRNGVLTRGSTTIRVDVSAALQRGQFVDANTFRARFDLHDADVQEILALVGYDYPVSGTMNLFLNASGTKADPRGSGRVQLTHATIYGEPVEHFNSDLLFANGQVELNNLRLTHYEARVTGDASFDPSTHAVHFNLTGKNFDLARVAQLKASRVSIGGSVNFTAVGSGTLEAPAIDAALILHDLTFDGERAGDFTVDAVTRGSDLHISGRSQFEHAELNVDGDIQLRGDWPAALNLRFDHLDADSLLRSYTQARVTGHSAVAGTLTLNGPLRKPDDLTLTANLSDLYADVEGIKVRSDGPVRFAVSHEFLNMEQFHLVGEDTDFTASGSVQLSGERRLDMRAQGKVNLKLIESFNSDFTSSGIVTVDMSVVGTAAKPSLQGRVQIANAGIAYVDLPSALSDVNGSLIFNQNRLQVETLTARVGGGTVSFGGYATTYNRQVNFDLDLHGQDVRLRYPPGVSSNTTADLHWVGSSTTSTLSGDITVNKLSITPGFDFAAYLERAAQASTLSQTNPLLNRIKLDVHIVTAPELRMQTASVRLSGDADLRLRGTAAKPVVLGRADVIEGEIYFNGTKYRLERGDVTFTNPVSTRPVLDLQASTHVRDYDITVNLNGEPDKQLKVNWRSEPPLPEADIIALLALGRTQEESAQLQQSGQSQFGQEASNALLSEALNATVSNRVQRLFGVSRIKIDPQGQNTETNAARGPQVTIEQQVANNLTLTYSTAVSQASQQIIQVEYNLTRNVSIIGIRDQNGVVSIDVKIRQRKK